jgi:predicted DsbA family dithiol-disulfide isomerase
MQVSCYFDYTCPYSYKALTWLRAARGGGADLEVAWRTFSLKEANRDPGTPSPFDDPGISSVSVLALALAHAARQAAGPADFDRYHLAVFQAMQVQRRRLDERALLELAGAAGVDVAAFDHDRARWLGAVAAEHRQAAGRLGVFGTPTLVLEGGAVIFIKLATPPAAGWAGELWQSLCTIARCHPELLEIKRPS